MAARTIRRALMEMAGRGGRIVAEGAIRFVEVARRAPS
jgi:hypothetical protein